MNETDQFVLNYMINTIVVIIVTFSVVGIILRLLLSNSDIGITTHNEDSFNHEPPNKD